MQDVVKEIWIKTNLFQRSPMLYPLKKILYELYSPVTLFYPLQDLKSVMLYPLPVLTIRGLICRCWFLL